MAVESTGVGEGTIRMRACLCRFRFGEPLGVYSLPLLGARRNAGENSSRERSAG